MKLPILDECGSDAAAGHPGREPVSFEHEEGSSATLRVFGIAQDSIVDGPGLRFVIFVQGCSHNCPGCHNPESHSPFGGQAYTVEALYDMVRANGLIRAVTLSGGEPFEQPEPCASLASKLKADGYNIWVYSGYTFERLLEMSKDNAAIEKLMSNTDVLVDGPFIESQHSYDLKWRGSANQRIIDVPASLKSQEARLFE